MSRLIESIKTENALLCNLAYHERRMNASSLELWSQNMHCVDFNKIRHELDQLDPDQLYKLRIVYDSDSFSHEFQKYSSRPIHSLKIVELDDLDYSHKYADRTVIEKAFTEKEDCDDILITQHGAITDSSYCNLAFKKGDVWYTPDQPLLTGTKRQYLLDQGTIEEAEIYIEDIPDFESLCLFNAMIEFGELELGIEAVQF